MCHLVEGFFFCFFFFFFTSKVYVTYGYCGGEVFEWHHSFVYWLVPCKKKISE